MDAGHVPAHRGPFVAGEGTIRALAECAVLGIPVLPYLRSRDPEERALLEAARIEAVKVVDELMTNLARKIVKEQADAQKRGKQSKK